MAVLTLALNDGRHIPQIGYGCWQLSDSQAPDLVGTALQAGYRLIDTAAAYGNEAGVGRAIRDAPVPREDIFLTTKLWNDRQGRDASRRAFDESLKRLGLPYVDLYLIHWPCPRRHLFVETWKTLIELRKEGRAKSIGVSNFTPEHVATLVAETGVTPAVNQIELHPHFQRKAPRADDARHGIVTEAWSPLGQGKELNDPAILAIAKAHGKSAAQVILRWQVQIGCVAIPKTARPERIRENIALFDFALSAEEMDRIAALDRADGRIGPDPATFC
ncbi:MULTISPECIES: aldo/keto reductase [unclassified Methylobacterium]|jgi:2,5-diketo-D-gluconate reductase A|uniref:aldo/keto reductase n=1 Tax=unclassified Methylobacterium TaxID=2615210 RepID=UPI0013527A0C|nr:aldo/keto reductase [Methylobacterium sp. 2A]MWV25595.1 aldo/keto reductase [Methylobacterium sp. 2A]